MTKEELDGRRLTKTEEYIKQRGRTARAALGLSPRPETTVSRDGEATPFGITEMKGGKVTKGLPVKGGEATLQAADKRWGTTTSASAEMHAAMGKRPIIELSAESPVVVVTVDKTWKHFTPTLGHECNQIDCDLPGTIRDGEFFMCEDHDGVLAETVAMQDG